MTGQESDWDLQPGDPVRRVDLHKRYGGRGQGGIGPSGRTPNVFIFSDSESGTKHGYIDQWMADGRFHYTGEGQRGDQKMIQGNAAVLNHRNDGRVLRVFDGARGVVTYRGEFEVDLDEPSYMADAPETGGGPVRQVIVFRLSPIDTPPGEPDGRLPILLAGGQVQEVPVENRFTEQAIIEPAREPFTSERREAELVERFADFLKALGHDTVRLKIVRPGERQPLFCDLVDRTAGVLYEAKGGVNREQIRMAIGQLIDYGRAAPDARPAILVPERPRADLLDLCEAAGSAVAWPDGSGFTATDRALW